MTERFTAALIGAPFGLKGHVKARPLSGEMEHLCSLQTATLRRDGREQTLRIEECVPQPPALLIKFAGIDSPEAAKALRGAELLVDRQYASPLKEGEFYIEDLKGLAVKAAVEGEILGHITDIVEGGGGELVEIKLVCGGIKLVPFRKEFFAEISPQKGSLLLRNLWILD